ncbi:MAG: AAA family ATPase [Phycisphaerae bacterium]|nr:AAA family ATPase [Phycisphaerae bacterium]
MQSSAEYGGPASAVAGQAEEPAPNPVELVLDRLHGRWLWAIILACVLAPSFAVAGWYVAPVKYAATGAIGIERQLDVAVFATKESDSIDLIGMVAEQAMLLSSEAVMREALRDARLQPFAGRIRDEDIGAIASGLSVHPQKGTGLISVVVESDSLAFSEAAARSLLKAYLNQVQPVAGMAFADKNSVAQTSLQAVRRQIEVANQERLSLLKSSPTGSKNLQGVIDERVARVRQREQEIVDARAMMLRVRDSLPPDAGDPADDATVTPTQIELERLNPSLTILRRDIDQGTMQLDLAARSYSPKHPIYQNVQKKLDLFKAQYDREVQNAKDAWSTGPAKVGRYGELTRRVGEAEKDIDRLRGEIDQLNLTISMFDTIERQLVQLGQEEQIYIDRLKQLSVEEKSLKGGRISVKIEPTGSSLPSKDKRAQLAAVGSIFGVVGSFAIFFLWGSVDKRAFGTRQLLAAEQGKLLLAGAIPDMKEIEGDSDAKDLATNCVHRVRTRIESRRTPGDGYALMVSSPFQGDGKTTLAVGLAWSYAESGYRTLLVDCDFIGQALSFQFGQLGAPGVREALQGQEPSGFVTGAGSDHLSILPVGRDRQFGASRVHPTGLRRLFRDLRNRFDIIIVDTGPMTASIEALPVASSVDGVVLSLRRGRSRERLGECISDIQSVGAEYLGVVLNYAEKKDCVRYGSVSRMSTEILKALEGRTEGPARHPLLAAIQQPQRMNDDRKDTAGDAA